MARLQRQRFQDSTDVRRFPNGKVEVVELDDRAIGRMTYEPGWRWSVDVKPVAATDSCQFHHVGLTISGRLRVQMTDGTELEVGPGEVFEFPPGHDAWVVGDVPWVSVDFEAVRRYGRSVETSGVRTLASILFTDIVDSTSHAIASGPAAWQDLVSQHNALSERVIDGYRGRLIKTTGDGVIGLFDSAERAVRAGAEIGRRVEPLGLQVRAGVHTGEVELVQGDVRGVAVHTASRIMNLAGPGEVWLSATVMELAADAGLGFEDAGEHELKGIPGTRRLYRIPPAGNQA
jgi:class 3 adenylate cyclase/mannose-6-phosphate isomerase-like protein (cupin superfamily)